MSDKDITINNVPTSIKKNWAWLFGLGILFIVLGCIGLGMSISITLVSMFFLGILLILGGLSQLFDSLKSKQWKYSTWHAFIALLYTAAGCLVIYDPFLASTVITALIAVILIFIGFIRLTISLDLQGIKGWSWFVLSGLAAILLGVVILVQWPLSGLWVIGLFIAIELIISGWTYVFIALALRQQHV